MENKTYKAIVRNTVYEVSFKTIAGNFKFIDTYNEMAESYGMPKDEGFETIEQYIELLALGKINYFNFSLGTSIPIMTFDDTMDLEIVNALFPRSQLSVSKDRHSLLFLKKPEKFSEVEAFCIENNISFTTENIDI